jgi:hypothetical protein
VWYEEYGVCAELDGAAYHDRDQARRDKDRDNLNLAVDRVDTYRFSIVSRVTLRALAPAAGARPRRLPLAAQHDVQPAGRPAPRRAPAPLPGIPDPVVKAVFRIEQVKQPARLGPEQQRRDVPHPSHLLDSYSRYSANLRHVFPAAPLSGEYACSSPKD